jgi:hypothetical protein
MQGTYKQSDGHQYQSVLKGGLQQGLTFIFAMDPFQSPVKPTYTFQKNAFKRRT